MTTLAQCSDSATGRDGLVTALLSLQCEREAESRAISWRARRRREQLGSQRALLIGRERCSQARLGLDRLAIGATTSQPPCARSTATRLSPGRDDARGGELAFLFVSTVSPHCRFYTVNVT